MSERWLLYSDSVSGEDIAARVRTAGIDILRHSVSLVLVLGDEGAIRQAVEGMPNVVVERDIQFRRSNG